MGMTLPTDSSYSRRDRDRDLEDILRGIGDYGREGLRRGGGAAFFLRHGDAMVAVRCDPQDSMKSCVDVTQSRPRKSGRADKWSFCLTAGTLCPANQERP